MWWWQPLASTRGRASQVAYLGVYIFLSGVPLLVCPSHLVYLPPLVQLPLVYLPRVSYTYSSEVTWDLGPAIPTHLRMDLNKEYPTSVGGGKYLRVELIPANDSTLQVMNYRVLSVMLCCYESVGLSCYFRILLLPFIPMITMLTISNWSTYKQIIF